MIPRVKTYPFARAKIVSPAELEEVYSYLAKHLNSLIGEVETLQTASSTSPVDYSYQIQQLNTQVTALQTDLAALQAQVAALNALQFEFVENDTIMLVTTPSGQKQILLADYP